MDVERWLAAAVPWWVARVVLVLGWLAAVAFAIESDPGTCTPATPCTPDVAFAIAVVLLLATPLLLLAGFVVTGCVAGAGFALLDLLFDDLPAANAAFGLHGFACALVALWVMRSRNEQRHVARGRPVSLLSGASWGIAPVAGVLFALAGLWAFLTYDAAVAEIDAHVAAASRVEAVVVNVSYSGLMLELPGDKQVQVSPLSPDSYRIGDEVPVLADGSWVRLVAEPEDVTWLLTLGFGAYFLVFLCVVRTWQRRSLWGRPLPSVSLGVEAIGGSRVLLRAFDGSAVAMVRIDSSVPSAPPRFADPDEFGRVWRGEEPAPPVPDLPSVSVAGDLSLGGRVALVVDDEVLAVATLRRAPAGYSSALPGQPVAAGSSPVSLPCVVRSTGQRLAEGVVLLAVAVVLLVAPSMHLVPLGALCTAAALVRLQPQMRLEHTVLVLHVGFFVYRVPWVQLHGVRSTAAQLVLAFGSSGLLVSVPHRVGLGEELMRLRSRALIAGGSSPVSRRLGPIPYIALGYLVLGWVIGH